jgi:hypothetical protein
MVGIADNFRSLTISFGRLLSVRRPVDIGLSHVWRSSNGNGPCRAPIMSTGLDGIVMRREKHAHVSVHPAFEPTLEFLIILQFSRITCRVQCEGRVRPWQVPAADRKFSRRSQRAKESFITRDHHGSGNHVCFIRPPLRHVCQQGRCSP